MTGIFFSLQKGAVCTKALASAPPYNRQTLNASVRTLRFGV